MEIKVKRDELFRSISKVQSIIEKRSNMPILSMVLLSADDSYINISATDLEISLQQTLPVEVITPGSITISGKKLFEILKEKESVIKSVMDTLLALQNQHVEKRKPHVHLFEKKEGIKTIYEDILRSNVKEFLALGGSGLAPKILPYYMRSFYEKNGHKINRYDKEEVPFSVYLEAHENMGPKCYATKRKEIIKKIREQEEKNTLNF